MRKLLLVFGLCLLTAACNKKEKGVEKTEEPAGVPASRPTSNSKEAVTTGPLTGSWRYVENYVSPGILWHWIKVKNGCVLTISADSTYEMAANGADTEFPFDHSPGRTFAGVLSNKTITKDGNIFSSYLTNAATGDTIYRFHHQIVNRNDTIDISLSCIEGCTYRFVKTQK